jgi:hypothetical protein
LSTGAGGTVTFYWQTGTVARAVFLVQAAGTLYQYDAFVGASGTTDGFSSSMKTALGISGAYTVVSATASGVQVFRPGEGL